jgi:hypothetical protein
MSESFGTCGHKLTGEGNPVALKARTREDVRAVATVVLCDACLERAELTRMVLHDEVEKRAWLERGGHGAAW